MNPELDLDQAPGQTLEPEKDAIRVNGFAQVLAMLQVADPEFRESLLRRLAQRDPQLARQLRSELD
jgi:hypothetical protein